MSATTISIGELYKRLKRPPMSEEELERLTLHTVVRLSDGLKNPQHARNILLLYWWHLLLTDGDKYNRLKEAVDEESFRRVLGEDAIMTTYTPIGKTITVASDMFSKDFFGVIDSYLTYTEELANRH